MVLVRVGMLLSIQQIVIGKMIESARYADSEQALIFAVFDGVEMGVPNVGSNRHRRLLSEWEAEGNEIAPYVEPEPILITPDTISDRQFAQQLAKLGLITETEALAWVSSGVIPEPFEIYIDSLPTEQQFDARMLLAGATQFDRHHPFTVQFGAARDMTPEQIDQLWRDAAQL